MHSMAEWLNGVDESRIDVVNKTLNKVCTIITKQV